MLFLFQFSPNIIIMKAAKVKGQMLKHAFFPNLSLIFFMCLEESDNPTIPYT